MKISRRCVEHRPYLTLDGVIREYVREEGCPRILFQQVYAKQHALASRNQSEVCACTSGMHRYRYRLGYPLMA